jgi:DNA-binding NtrC family response regulator
MLGGVHRNETGEDCEILVFDEEVVILDLLATVLHREGYRVSPTRRWDEALHLATRRRYDLVIADVELRRRDGCRLVATLRHVSPDTPIVAMTAYPAREVVAFAEEHVQAFLVKPFGIGQLLQAVRTALGGRAPSHSSRMASLAPLQQSVPILAAGS